MGRWQRRWLGAVFAGLLASLATVSAAPAPEEAPTVQVRPRPSDIEPRAAQALALAIVNNGRHLLTVGERGQILVSNDGVHWAQVAVPVRAALTAIGFADGQVGWAVGHDATILKTRDGGKTWQLQNFEPEKEAAFLSLAVTDAQHAYAVGASGLFYATRDGGLNWSEFDAPAIRAGSPDLRAITPLRDGSLLVVGQNGLIGVSPAGGKWQRLKSPVSGTLFGALAFGAHGALVFGAGGAAYLSDDVRVTRWRRLDLASEASLYGGVSLDDGRSLLVGAPGEVQVVDPQGQHVRSLVRDDSGSLSGVARVNGGLVVVGEGGVRRLDAAL